jgi:hypothetical protein
MAVFLGLTGPTSRNFQSYPDGERSLSRARIQSSLPFPKLSEIVLVSSSEASIGGLGSQASEKEMVIHQMLEDMWKNRRQFGLGKSWMEYCEDERNVDVKFDVDRDFDVYQYV